MLLDMTVLKHEVRRYFPKGSTEPRHINQVHGFATMLDGFQQPLIVNLPTDHAQLEIRRDYQFRIVDVSAFDRRVTFTADSAKPLAGPPTLPVVAEPTSTAPPSPASRPRAGSV